MARKAVYWGVGILLLIGVVNFLGSSPSSSFALQSPPSFQNTIQLASPEVKNFSPIPFSTVSLDALTFSTPNPVATLPSVAAPNGYYTNVDGNSIIRPYRTPRQPSGATALCGDGTYSFSQHRSGTCSHHGGVASWL